VIYSRSVRFADVNVPGIAVIQESKTSSKKTGADHRKALQKDRVRETGIYFATGSGLIENTHGGFGEEI
jgi:hypothetical protein